MNLQRRRCTDGERKGGVTPPDGGDGDRPITRTQSGGLGLPLAVRRDGAPEEREGGCTTARCQDDASITNIRTCRIGHRGVGHDGWRRSDREVDERVTAQRIRDQQRVVTRTKPRRERGALACAWRRGPQERVRERTSAHGRLRFTVAVGRTCCIRDRQLHLQGGWLIDLEVQRGVAPVHIGDQQVPGACAQPGHGIRSLAERRGRCPQVGVGTGTPVHLCRSRPITIASARRIVHQHLRVKWRRSVHREDERGVTPVGIGDRHAPISRAQAGYVRGALSCGWCR